MDYNAPSGSTDPNAGYVGKTASTVGSKVPPKAAEYPQREIVAAERAAGLTPSNDDTTQLPQAIGRGLYLGPLGANPNALVGIVGGGLDPTFFVKALQPWTRLRGLALQTNTSPNVTVTVYAVGSPGGVVSGPLLRKDGTLPVPGDVPVGFPFDVQPDGLGNFRFVGSTPSDITPLVVTWWVDPVNGDDTRDGKSAAKAKKTIEAVAGYAPPNTRHVVLLLGNITMQVCSPLQTTMALAGAQVAANPAGYTLTQRTLTLVGEATNSPTADGVRRSSGFLMTGQIALRNIDLVLPDQPAGVTTRAFVGANLSSVTMTDCSVNGVTAGNASRLVTPSDASPMGFWFLGTIGASMSGRIFDGVSAGADPNAGRRYQSNLTSN